MSDCCDEGDDASRLKMAMTTKKIWPAISHCGRKIQNRNAGSVVVAVFSVSRPRLAFNNWIRSKSEHIIVLPSQHAWQAAQSILAWF